MRHGACMHVMCVCVKPRTWRVRLHNYSRCKTVCLFLLASINWHYNTFPFSNNFYIYSDPISDNQRKWRSKNGWGVGEGRMRGEEMKGMWRQKDGRYTIDSKKKELWTITVGKTKWLVVPERKRGSRRKGKKQLERKVREEGEGQKEGTYSRERRIEEGTCI